MGADEVVIQEIIRRILTVAQPDRVILFGSAARGDAGPCSDLDLLVSLAHGRSLLDLVAMKQDLQDLLGCEVDVVTEAAISPYVRDQVLKEAVAL